MNYNELPTAVLVDSLPENRPLYKDSGLWTIYDDDFETPILKQTASEDFRQFLIRYYEFIAEFEDMENVDIDLAVVVLQSEQLKPIDGISLEALNATIKKVGKKKPTLKNRL